MFDNQWKPTDLVNKFIIVYDKISKTCAKQFFNELANKDTIVFWSEKEYRHNEGKLTNNNKILFLVDELITENIFSPECKIKISDYATFLSHGNSAGLSVDNISSIPKEYSIVIRNNWKKLVVTMLLGGLISVGAFATYLAFNEKKQLKISILLEAAKQLCKKDNITLKSFLDGTCRQTRI